MEDEIKKAIDANIIVHSTLADEYNLKEPHFRPESIERVTKILEKIYSELNFENALDLGCGTGFMINILKKRAKKIVGVDVTQAMLDKVDLAGQAEISLINSDTGTVDLPQDHFDIATAYTFLDHLYDMKPTFRNTYNSLKKGGVFYADLSPNFYFWQSIKSLDFSNSYDSILQREINAVLRKDEEIEKEFGIDKEVFSMAEHQKHKLGGLDEITLKEELMNCGFSKVEFIYHWFVGQAELINNTEIDLNERKNTAEHMHNYLTRSLPLSRQLFKYVGFIATK
jgi:ubiquinone/menaquinone biosynthesis C-methylase UbiE